MINLIKDLSVLTTIPEKTLDKLLSKSLYCISDAVVESKSIGNNVVDIDIGLGTLSIKLSDETIEYKFVPSSDLHTSVKSSVLEERNLLEDKLEQSFVDKVTNLYKDLI